MNNKITTVNTDDVTINNFPSNYATQTTLSKIAGNVEATLTRVDAINTKIVACNTNDLATESTLLNIEADCEDIKQKIDNIESGFTVCNTNDVTINNFPTDYSTETTLTTIKNDIEILKNNSQIALSVATGITLGNIAKEIIGVPCKIKGFVYGAGTSAFSGLFLYDVATAPDNTTTPTLSYPLTGGDLIFTSSQNSYIPINNKLWARAVSSQNHTSTTSITTENILSVNYYI
jgi:hypothetical protein